MSSRPRFVELCARSNFSFLLGASHPEELVAAARELEMPAIGITDLGGIYGLVRAYRETRENGGRLVTGAELDVDLELVEAETGAPARGPHSVILFARNHDGYRSLCRLLTRSHEGRDKGVCALRLSDLSTYSAGLELAFGVDAPLLRGRELDPHRWSPSWRAPLEAFRGHTHVAAHRRLDGLDARRTEAAKMLAGALDAGVFATARPLYHHPSRKPVSDVVHCIREGTTLDQAGRALSINAEARLRSGEQMAALFRDEPGWVERSADLADELTFSFSELCYRFPSDDWIKSGETSDEALERQTREGLALRYPTGAPAKVVEQCDKELALIKRLGVAPYFLSVKDVVEMARRRRILCQGRGSAANSAVCFALGITAVDPARSNLLFERFLSAERAEPPDIDVDFEHERREEVIQEIYEKYSRERAAMVCEVICYRGKSALRETGKAFGLATEQLDRLSSLVMRWDLSEVTEKTVLELGLDPRDARLMRAITIARTIEGFPRHLSIHVGGFVLSAEPLDRVAPVEPARMPGRTVIPWDKDDLDTLGFFKIDVLGLGMLTCVRKCLELLYRHGEPVGDPDAPFDPIESVAAIPAEDPAVYDAIGKADTVGVFQIESRAQMSMLPRLRPRCFYDLVIEVAIVRPGPIQGGMVHPYLRRRSGKEPARAPHRILEPILERTLGVPLFQEQVMQIAMTGAGYTAGEADQLRRDMAAWKKHGRLERHRDRLLGGFAARGISRDFGEALFKQIQGFGEYGFPESHAASFALIVYASAWQKTHHPAAFACSLLNSQPMGFYSPSSIVQDAQRHGVVVRPVDIAKSDWDNLLEPLAEPRSYALRLGFRQVSGLGEDAGKRIEEARAHAPFESIGDLERRAALKKNELDALAESGALEPLVEGRRDAMWRARAPKLGGLFEEQDLEREAPPPRLIPLSPMEQLLLDYGRTGLSLTDHPMRHVRAHLASERVSRAADLPKLRDRQAVRVAGLVIGRQRPQTASGVTFVSLEDETGVMNLVVTVPVFEKYRHAILHSTIVLVRGRLEREGDVIHVLARSVERLELESAGGPLRARSRDFH
ncbi:MAG: error-prone DNA polymerase [Polyangiaceae bacterium]